MIIGITFSNIEYEEGDKRTKISNTIPEDLIDVWKEKLSDLQPADVEFNVQGEKFHAYSSVLSKRSEYFAKILSGQWAEKTTNPLEENSPDQIKYRIEIQEFEPKVFLSMLEYLYTNKVEWTNEDGESITIKLFCLADKYLLSDLRKRAKTRIYDELEISNASEILFGLVPSYEDLKEPVLKFMAKNFEEVYKSQEFKDILENLANYPSYNVIFSELFEEHFKQKKTES